MSGQTRALTLQEWEAFRLGRLVAAERVPYFMHALFATAPVAAPGLGTFAVDGGWRLYLDPDLLVGDGRWDSATVAGVLIHEVGHLLRDHAGRAALLPTPRDHLAWNLACFPAGTLLPHGVPIEQAATIRRPFDGDLIVIASQAGKVEATPEHPFWTRQRRHKKGVHPVVLNDPEWVSAGELDESHYLCVPG